MDNLLDRDMVDGETDGSASGLVAIVDIYTDAIIDFPFRGQSVIGRNGHIRSSNVAPALRPQLGLSGPLISTLRTSAVLPGSGN